MQEITEDPDPTPVFKDGWPMPVAGQNQTSPFPEPRLRWGAGEREFWKALVLAFAANSALIDGVPVALSAPLLADQVIRGLRERSQ